MDADPSISDLERRFKAGSIVRGVVTHHTPIGFFVDLGDPNEGGLVRIVDVKDEAPVMEADFPPIGSKIEAYVWGVATGGRPHVILSVRPSVLRGAV